MVSGKRRPEGALKVCSERTGQLTSITQEASPSLHNRAWMRSMDLGSLLHFKISLPAFWFKTELRKKKVLRKSRWVRSKVVTSNSRSTPSWKPGPHPRVSGPPLQRMQGNVETSGPEPWLGNKEDRIH